MEFKEPIVVTWADILVTYQEGEERGYNGAHAPRIRHAISRRLKFTHSHMVFSTRVEDDGNVYVRRLTEKEITQQQPSETGAGQ